MMTTMHPGMEAYIAVVAIIAAVLGLVGFYAWREERQIKRPDTATPTQWCVISGCEGVVVRGECPDCGYCQDDS